MIMIVTFFFLGILFGFVGSGGVGFIIAVLNRFFDIPIHTALGTSMLAMALTMISGSISHYRENNVHIKYGIVIGLSGAVGAYLGSLGVSYVDEGILRYFTGGLLYLAAITTWYRTRIQDRPGDDFSNSIFWFRSILIGVICGGIAGLFGIGSAPFIQLSLIVLCRLSVVQAAGTSMLVILPVAIFGSLGFYQKGYIDFSLLLEVVIGTFSGSYIGAKFTKRSPRWLLRYAMIFIPISAATLLVFR
jgi:hypothetical protein